MTTLRPTAGGSDRSSRGTQDAAPGPPTRDVLILGVGNRLLRDDGVGCRVVAELVRPGLPAGIQAVDGGTLGRDLLPLVATTAALVGEFTGREVQVEGKPGGPASCKVTSDAPY